MSDPIRCNPPACRRPKGHRGACRETHQARAVCGAYMAKVDDYCARTPGHGWEHRTWYALDNNRRWAK